MIVAQQTGFLGAQVLWIYLGFIYTLSFKQVDMGKGDASMTKAWDGLQGEESTANSL